MIGQAVGNYRIVEKLGRGGMGVVYLAEHTMMGKRAAVKVLLPEFSNDKEVVGRFFNEAKAAARIRHPGIVDVFDFGFDAGGGAYISMELLEGESLAARLDKLERLDEIPAVRIARQAARALSAAHKAGIIHRDLKPDNVFLLADPEVTGGERVKILDFGIAKLTVPGEAMFSTRAGMTMGTPYYMSPEQARGSSDLDARTDIYSLGCVLYHMVCGSPPFIDPEESSPVAILRQHINEPPPPTRFHTDGVTAELEGMLMVMLSKQPDDRFQSMDDVVAAFDQLGYDTRTAYGPAIATPVPGTLTSAPLQPPPLEELPPDGADDEASGPRNLVTTLPGTPVFVDHAGSARHASAATDDAAPEADDEVTPARGTPAVTDEATPAHGTPAAAGSGSSTSQSKPLVMSRSALSPERRSSPNLRESAVTLPRRRALETGAKSSPTTLTSVASQSNPRTETDFPERNLKPLFVVGALLILAAGAGIYALSAGGGEKRAAAQDTDASGRAAQANGSGSSSASTAGASRSDEVSVEPIQPESEMIKITITSDPSGADVFRVFDGVRLGTTPFETSVGRGPGDLVLVLKQDGRQDARLDIPLEKDFSAYVELESSTSSSHHHRHGHDTSRTPRDAAPGQSGSGATAPPADTQAAGTGTLRVVSEPSCEVVVDGKVRGSTPIAKIELPAGSHTLQLINSRFNIDRTETIVIEPDKITKKRYQFPTGAP